MKDKVKEIKDRISIWTRITYKEKGDASIEMGLWVTVEALIDYISQLEDRVEVLERDKNKEDMYKSMGL